MPTHTVMLLRREEIAESIMSFYFDKPAGFQFKPGQYLDCSPMDPPETDAEGNIRTFSIASAPAEKDLMVATRMRDTAFKRVLKVMKVLRKQLGLLDRLVELFCRALTEVYEQVNILAVDGTLHRLIKALLRLAAKIGHRSGQMVEIPTYLTQEEILHKQFVSAARVMQNAECSLSSRTRGRASTHRRFQAHSLARVFSPNTGEAST